MSEDSGSESRVPGNSSLFAGSTAANGVKGFDIKLECMPQVIESTTSEKSQTETHTSRLPFSNAYNENASQYQYPLAAVETPEFLRSFTFEHGGLKQRISEFQEHEVEQPKPVSTVHQEPHQYPYKKRQKSTVDEDGYNEENPQATVGDQSGERPAKRVKERSTSPVFGNSSNKSLSAISAANNFGAPATLPSPTSTPVVCDDLTRTTTTTKETTTTTTVTTVNTNNGSTIMKMPSMISSFESLPSAMKRYLLFNFLRGCDRSTLSFASSVILPALRCDILSQVPPELAFTILSELDCQSLVRASSVCKNWKNVIESADWLWKELLVKDEYFDTIKELDEYVVQERCKQHQRQQQEEQVRDQKIKQELESSADDDMTGYSASRSSKSPVFTEHQDLGVAPTPAQTPSAVSGNPMDMATAAIYKPIYRRKHLIHSNWMDPNSKPKHISVLAHGKDVVTSLQFDDDKIITGSDDFTINVYDIKNGQVRSTLRGHDGGVWAMQYVGSNTLVSGATDRTVRVWDIANERCTHVFEGHTSTVRCLYILHPVAVTDANGVTRMEPDVPLIVTGSRDATLRIWKLPQPGDPEFNVNGDAQEADPFFLRTLSGHTHNVRAIAGHGNTIVSASYDTTVRVWNVKEGTCRYELRGHEQRVYGAVIDKDRNRCISGSMDCTVKVWCLEKGTLLYNLEGHSSLVGLLDLGKTRLVTASADSTVRIWDPETGVFINKLTGHQGAITGIQYDENKLVSASEKTLKLWDSRRGVLVRDLLDGLNSIWQVKFDESRCVCAVKRGENTRIEVFDFDYDPFEENYEEALDECHDEEVETPSPMIA